MKHKIGPESVCTICGWERLDSNALWVSSIMQLVAISRHLALPVRITLLDLRFGGDFC